MTPLELTGRSRTHIVEVSEPPCALHAGAVAPFLNLRREARSEGFDLVPVSSFRDFARQLAIWNAKFSGEKPLYDAEGRTLEAGSAGAGGTHRGNSAVVRLARSEPAPLGNGSRSHRSGSNGSGISRAADGGANTPRRAPSDGSRTGWRTTRRVSAFSGPSAVCCRACSRNPGISASHRWRSPRAAP